jgi:hypothetical protein
MPYNSFDMENNQSQTPLELKLDLLRSLREGDVNKSQLIL